MSKSNPSLLPTNGRSANADDPVGAVARVPLAEADAGDQVLGAGQDPVADVLVERHAAAACAARVEHPRPEHGVDRPASANGASRSGIFSGAY